MKRELHSLVFTTLFALSASGGLTLAQEVNPDDSQISNAEPSITFQRHQFTISRQNGKILIDGQVVLNHFHDSKGKELGLIEIFDNVRFPTDREFLEWARKLRGTRSYTYDEVTQVGPDGASATKPLVFFDKAQRAELDSKWQAWLDKRSAKMEEENRLRMVREREAQTYQQQAQLQQLQTQVLLTQAAAAQKSAESLAVISGETSLWEIELIPVGQIGGCPGGCSGSYYGFPSINGYETSGTIFTAFGTGNVSASFGNNYLYGSGSNSLYVRNYGRTSQVASYLAIQENPGYRVGHIRKLAGY